ncbi:MAG: UDP-N-acetylmuramoyl-L-alanyl-D-glutamate--2,6-diaminopimelate ligase [Luteitalea sp.]|nr:UDP-N-acetylmuramoyl-L-alanyl-D-glutamate--2,6-diaminopimelate ligase [Luteitalea sp.]
MTWAELHGALRERGQIRAGGAPRVNAASREVHGVAYDSRRVSPGSVFVALKGQHVDGAAFAREALARGAAAIVSEAPAPPGAEVPWTVVHDSRLALAILAVTFYRHPSAELKVIGITGTNGKTTTAYLVASIFDAAGVRCGLLGTVGYRVGDEVREATRTTPEAPDLQCLLRDMVDRGCGACAMEVSSHALSLRRADGIVFAAGVFTNLTRDHLDFHDDMEAYFQAKRRLFEILPGDSPSLINLDDPRGASLCELAARPVTYAISRPADIMPGPLSISLGGLSFDVRTRRGSLRVRSSLVGRPNVYNILAAVATAVALDVPFEVIENGIAALEGVPGRFQLASGGTDDVTVVVDYAHTDDALRNLLETARPLTRGRVITVFGCGGDRDRTKRPLMGVVAGRLSDVLLITSDNPRHEDPRRIIEEIRLGITPDTRRDSEQQILTYVDRRDAILKAVELARAGDLVLIAGKGHEKYQAIGTSVLPFDDVAVAREALSRRRSNSGVV